eukprot:CAMPEP_0172907020 /NCGR_PEP_ID=MMETSP1075-20121228/178000_1 /TAXON_ID=2916 /ORGANISM="Ceratium fusus, Strain PA161109" /LENGTH=52 /DNA_ID=CAMNT_0013764559 /DNA_START=162 /DNA_END=317 /DNA_ORIENTATION=+
MDKCALAVNAAAPDFVQQQWNTPLIRVTSEPQRNSGKSLRQGAHKAYPSQQL